MTLTFGSLFAGIGGFDIGFERAGMVCKWQVEIDPFCLKVLAKHWPHVARYENVRECGKHNLETVDVIAGGFPCQPFSQAGEQRGEQDDRNLWPEMRRVVAELRPRWVVAENVPGIRNIYLDQVLSDLEGLDYTAGTVDLPAVAFGAPHLRHRLFIVAYANGPKQGRRQQPERGTHQRNAEPPRDGTKGRIDSMAFASNPRLSRTGSNAQQQGSQQLIGNGGAEKARTVADAAQQFRNGSDNNRSCEPRQMSELGNRIEKARPVGSRWLVEPIMGRVAHGIPARVDRLRALGNAIVPQVAQWLGQRIMEVEKESPSSAD